MPRWLPIAAAFVVALFVAVPIVKFIAHQNAELEAAREYTADALDRAMHAEAEASEMASIAVTRAGEAQAAGKRADSIAVAARTLRTQLKAARAASDSQIVAAPDTCQTYLKAVANARDLASETASVALQAADSSRAAYDTLAIAFDSLKVSHERVATELANLYGASSKLVKASGRSVWKALLPEVRPGAAFGYDPNARSFHPVVGVTLSWSF